MIPSQHLSRAERIARIGELLAKGVTLLLTQEAASKEHSKPTTTNSYNSTIVDAAPSKPKLAVFRGKNLNATHTAAASQNGLDTTDENQVAIIHYLARVGDASPRDIQLALDLSKATAFRRLQELVQAGTVTRTGQTKAIRYRLTPTGHMLTSDSRGNDKVLKRASVAA